VRCQRGPPLPGTVRGPLPLWRFARGRARHCGYGPDQETWGKVFITIERSDGGIVDAEIIRPRLWILRNGMCAGRMLPLILPELEVSGLAFKTRGQPPNLSAKHRVDSGLEPPDSSQNPAGTPRPGFWKKD
jgi:hypothetical protein